MRIKSWILVISYIFQPLDYVNWKVHMAKWVLLQTIKVMQCGVLGEYNEYLSGVLKQK